MKRNRNEYYLITASFCYLIIGVVCLIISTYGFCSTLYNSNLSEGLVLIPLILISMTVVFLNSKICFYKKRDGISKYLGFNKWIAILQIVKLKIFGVFFFFSFGPEIIFYFFSVEGYKLGVKYEIFDLNYTISYFSGELSFLIGINVIAVGFFFLFNKLSKFYSLQEVI